jgi:hypothetical protein
MVRQVVEDFVTLGPLPASDASDDAINRHELALGRIQRPVTDAEAALCRIWDRERRGRAL